MLSAAILLKKSYTFMTPQASVVIHHNHHRTGMNFGRKQRALLNEMTDRTEKSLRAEQLEKFRHTQGKLVAETAFVSALLFVLLWLACDNPFVPFPTYWIHFGMGKYIEMLGGKAKDASAVRGQAHFTFLIHLSVLVGKLRVHGLIEIPSILGFFTYQIASLTQV
jgi:hypothetical protein